MAQTKQKETKNGNIEDFREQLELMKALRGIGGGEPAPDDEEYAIFTDGPHADRQFRRVAKPSYGQQKAVEEVRMAAKDVCFRLGRATTRQEFHEQAKDLKERVCDELGWDPGEKISWELSGIDYHEKILPLVCRDLPDEWDIDNVNGYEVERMLKDFLLDT